MKLSPVEIGIFEKLFDMKSGYVLDFSNKTFDQFIFKSVDINVRDDEYIKNVENEYNSSSKANILRYLWNTEAETTVIKLLKDMVDYCELLDEIDEELLDKAKQILNKHDNHINYKIDNTHSEEKSSI